MEQKREGGKEMRIKNETDNATQNCKDRKKMPLIFLNTRATFCLSTN